MNSLYSAIAAVIPILLLALTVEVRFGDLVVRDFKGERNTWVTGRPERLKLLISSFRLVLGVGLAVELGSLLGIALTPNEQSANGPGDYVVITLVLLYVALLLAWVLIALESVLVAPIERALDSEAQSPPP